MTASIGHARGELIVVDEISLDVRERFSNDAMCRGGLPQVSTRAKLACQANSPMLTRLPALVDLLTKDSAVRSDGPPDQIHGERSKQDFDGH